jgi:polysaccharide export outer membrane protein
MSRLTLMRLILTPALAAVAWLLVKTSEAQAQSAAADSASPPKTVALVTVDTSSLKPGDVLRLRIWREPDLSGDFPIDESGSAILPRLGPMLVTGIPAVQLKQRLTSEYQKFLNNPSIEVTPLRRIAILGAVRNPGIYPIDPSITLGQAPSIAGGAIPDSKRNMIELRRNGSVREVDLKKQPALAGLPLSSGDQVYIPERSWFSKNATWVVSTAIGVAGTTALLLTR